MSQPRVLEPVRPPRPPGRKSSSGLRSAARVGDHAAAHAAPNDLAVTIAAGACFADVYRIDRRLPHGAIGPVFAATDTALGRRVTIEMLEASTSRLPGVNDRFLVEARASMRLVDRHVVEAYDAGISSGTPFWVREWLDGETLAQRLERTGGMTLVETVDVARAIGSALGAAHAKGIVHRNLDATSVFFSRDATGETIKVAAFGVAGVVDAISYFGMDGARTGTPFHLRPEQVGSGRDAGPRCDLWSLAVLLFRCLAGVLPVERGPADTAAQKFSEVARRVTPSANDPSPWLDVFFERAFDPRAGERFEGAPEMTEAFEAAVSRERAARAFESTPPTSMEARAAEEAIALRAALRNKTVLTPGRSVAEGHRQSAALLLGARAAARTDGGMSRERLPLTEGNGEGRLAGRRRPWVMGATLACLVLAAFALYLLR